MRETRLSGSEGGGTESNRLSLPLSTFRPFGAAHLDQHIHFGICAAGKRGVGGDRPCLNLGWPFMRPRSGRKIVAYCVSYGTFIAFPVAPPPACSALPRVF